MEKRILVFGDSIAYGAWDSTGGWVERLKREAHRKTVEARGEEKVQVLNMGIGGDTSERILRRMEGEILARNSKSWPLTIVFSYGTNDERATDGVVEVSAEKLVENTRAIIEIARKYAERVVFLEAASLAREVVIFKGQEYSNERIREYSRLMREVVEGEGLSWVATRELFGADGLHCYDDLHPNDAGHELMYKAICGELGF